MLAIGVIAGRTSRLQHVSTPAGRFRLVESSDRAFDDRGIEVQPLGRCQNLVPSELLNRPGRRTPHRRPCWPARFFSRPDQGILTTSGRVRTDNPDSVFAEQTGGWFNSRNESVHNWTETLASRPVRYCDNPPERSEACPVLLRIWTEWLFSSISVTGRAVSK
jgi:hypothetical protein